MPLNRHQTHQSTPRWGGRFKKMAPTPSANRGANDDKHSYGCRNRLGLTFCLYLRKANDGKNGRHLLFKFFAQLKAFFAQKYPSQWTVRMRAMRPVNAFKNAGLNLVFHPNLTA